MSSGTVEAVREQVDADEGRRLDRRTTALAGGLTAAAALKGSGGPCRVIASW